MRCLDAYLDWLPAPTEGSSEDSESTTSSVERDREFVAAAEALKDAPHINHLLHVVQSLGTTTSSNALLPTWRIRFLLRSSGILDLQPEAEVEESDLSSKSSYEKQIEWILVSKATVQLFGVVLNTLLDRIVPLDDDIWYWDEVLSSYTYSSLYTVQVSPLRFWAWSQEIYIATRARIETPSPVGSPSELVNSTRTGLSRQWSQFYGIVQDTIRERSFANVQRKVLSPVAFSRAEARRKQAQLKKLRQITASGLGVLMCEGIHFTNEDDIAHIHERRREQDIVESSVTLMNMVLRVVSDPDVSIDDFEEEVFTTWGERAAEPPFGQLDTTIAPNPTKALADRLMYIIDKVLPQHEIDMQRLIRQNGRPPALIRYWLPGIVGVLSSTTILRILVNRKADIIDWVADFGATVRDFWFNWVVEPTQKVLRTIRHDDSSEIAIMSRDSLKADRESLERMVVDFAIDKPHFAFDSTSLSEAQIAEIRSKVAEGDVTPVLKAFEKDLRKPFIGAVRGDLVRSLLIQVQKTKVDLEVAMTGIDALLKSQELVFGFVGLTPGLLVSLGAFRYLSTVFGSRTGQRQSKKATRAVRVIRNIDRILAEAKPTRRGDTLSYKDQGLLLCEVHLLRDLAHKLMPRSIEKEFLEDVDDLANYKGIQVQIRALERLRWAYAKWLK